ncbi:ABC transporter permease [Chitinophaga ginsengisoli]|uniref:Putative ABC transport system permease protein n=1 Tax=Chitinophaga ginsengisoli TaxID=363837 RepID=A0A2P8GP50_9BACT|nr:ABC transporter permease [Chitinophaga ginsengisoli]PSL35750.1 putative ABC transport system permease protein [Chitinophaga ginsengisoli]
MIKNYLKIAWRNIRKQKFYSFINILGLTIGMTCCFLIFMYVRFELSYDSFHKNKDRIYRVVTDVKTPTELIEADITSAPMGPNIKADFPEVVSSVRINQSNTLVAIGNNKYDEDKMVYADATFFDVFSFPLIRGNAKEALTAPFTAVLTESNAKRYFGSEDPIGKTFQIDGGKATIKVTGLMKDVPENSHLPFDMVLSLATAEAMGQNLTESWGNFGMLTYLLLTPGTDPAKLEKKLPAFMESHIGSTMKGNNMYYTLHLEPLKDVYMTSKRNAPVKGSMTNIYIFSIVAILILLIAVINFVNLATARATERAREVGVRKSVGAYESQLTFQFLCETMLLSLFAFVLSVALSQLLLPPFNLLAGKEIAYNIFSTGAIVWFLLIAISVGLLAGIYPALVLSSYKPVVVLKGAFSSSNKGLFLRRGLVVFQFVITIVLIVGVMIVYYQLLYLQGRDLGFKKEQQLVVEFGGVNNMKERWHDIKQQVLNVQGVSGVTFSSAIPGRFQNSAYSNIEMKNGEMQASNINLYFVDYDFIKQYEIKMVAGRTFLPEMATDSTQAMLVNEAVVSSLGYNKPEEIIGKKFDQWGRKGTIIGVMKNFNYRSLKETVSPLTMRIEPEAFGPLTITVDPKNIKKVIAGVEAIYSRYVPEGRFNYFFVNDDFDRQYRGDFRFGQLVLTFAILAIFLATLGLLGLISYIVIQRTKEIGIRKVLGASVNNILLLLSTDFIKLIAIALVVATPLAWYLMYKWLQDFAYRIDMPWWVFLAAGSVAVVIALATVSIQTMKAAMTNPVKSLRTE